MRGEFVQPPPYLQSNIRRRVGYKLHLTRWGVIIDVLPKFLMNLAPHLQERAVTVLFQMATLLIGQSGP